MKKIWFGLAILVLAMVLAPSEIQFTPKMGSTELASLPAMSPEEAEVARDVLLLQQLVEETLTWRVRAADFARVLQEKDRKREAYDSKDLETLHAGVESYVSQRVKIKELADKYAWLGESERKLILWPEKGSLGLSPTETGDIVIDPLDAQGRLTLQKLKLSLAAALTLYDNYLIAIVPYQNYRKARKLINFDNSRLKNSLVKITESYLNPSNLLKVQRGIETFELEQSWAAEQKKAIESARETGVGGLELAERARVEYLNTLILTSVNYERIRNADEVATIMDRVHARVQKGSDKLSAFGEDATNTLSKVFGNTVGAVQFRSGKLRNMPENERKAIEASLKPLDILLEKTPHRLTDTFIPGFFGHVAIWLGTEKELRELGVWSRLPQKYQKQIQQGRSVLEALRPGVMLNTFEHFLDIDDLAVIRHRQLPNDPAAVAAHLLRAFEQIGKPYDFNFDTETSSSIVCSELAYVIYTDEKWPRARSMGRVTISPDHVAAKAGESAPFEVQLLYHDGIRIDGAVMNVTFATLLRDSKPEIQEMERLLVMHRASASASGLPPMSIEAPSDSGWSN
ncbi:MAG: hypothetical protein NDI61_12690 [Bdellovibrionaceae bacterium]|nr:hypothetical protein [Pseudobdellovibrionaceae bacterium]